jgi:hypothetical protein
MAIRREDYILELIDELQAFVAQALHQGDTGKMGQALMTLVRAQEKLFARPMAEFAALPIDEQLRLLVLNETPEKARAKVLAYAALLTEGGKIYGGRGRADLAGSAFQLALYVTLIAAAGDRLRSGELQPAIEQLRARVPDGELNAPVREMLARLAEPLRPAGGGRPQPS